MITKQGLIQRHNELVKYAKQEDSPYGSIPEPLFIGVKFNPNNWNGGDAIIRQFTSDLQFNEGTRHVGEFDWEHKSGDFVANWDYFDDQSYIQIVIRAYDEREGEWIFDQYLITYYKNRGKTDAIYKNGKLITLDEYIEILNIIESTGFKFDMNI